MYWTGKQYNLRIDSYVDERQDPYKSTVAAAHYLKDLYKIYNDWLLVIAAYNCGPGRVNRAIRLAGGKTNYWDIYYYLPYETRGYVPAFVAANYVLNYYPEHNISPLWADFVYQYDTLSITKQSISLEHVAEITGTSLQLLKNLNPSLKLNTIPYSTQPYILKVPPATLRFVDERRDSIYTTLASLASTKIIYHTVASNESLETIGTKYGIPAASIVQWNGLNEQPTLLTGQSLKLFVKSAVAAAEPPKNVNPKYYRVQPGDTLWDIAQKYNGVTIESLRQLNNLGKNSRLQIGQLLILSY